MLNQLQPQEGKYQEGSSQIIPPPQALLASDLQLEEREVEDWLRFAQDFSNLLHYYNDQNEPEGFWNGFLSESLPSINVALDIEEKEASLKNFRVLLSRYLDGHIPVNISSELHQKLQSPHRALFLTFLKLLEEIKVQFNQLPQRHLDFHYRDLLDFEALPAIADEVHVQVSLTNGVEQIVLAPETEFIANPNNDNQVAYRIDHLLPLNQIKLEAVHQIYLKKTVKTISEIRKSGDTATGNALLELMQFALGEKGSGTTLPKIPIVEGRLTGEESLREYYEEFKKVISQRVEATEVKPFWDYLQESLFMTYDDFDFVMKTEQRAIEELPSYPLAWEKVYAILRRAYLTKDSFSRKKKLMAVFNAVAATSKEQGFLDTFTYVFDKGSVPVFPPYDNNTFDLQTLIEHVESEVDSKEYSRASNYLESDLFITTIEFKKVKDILYSDIRIDREWSEVFVILERVMREYQEIEASEPKETNIDTLHAYALDPEIFENNKETFQSVPLLGDDTAPQAILGWQISSPLFILNEGRRAVTCYLRLAGTKLEELKEFFNAPMLDSPNPFLHASWQLEDEKIDIETAQFSYGNFIVSDPIERAIGSIQEEEGGLALTLDSSIFNVSKHVEYLILKSDGSLFEISHISDSHSAGLAFLTQFTPLEFAAIGAEVEANEFLLYHSEAIFYTSIKIDIELAPDFPALTTTIEGQYPVLILDLNETYQYKKDDLVQEGGLQSLLRNYSLDQVLIQIKAHDLEIKSIENDSSGLEAKNPYFPFGDPCEYGNSFYFTHDEIAAKIISTLDLNLVWPQVPKKFSEHYKTYYNYLAAADPSHENSAYKGKLSFKDPYKTVLIEDNVPLFSSETSSNPEEHLMKIKVADQLLENEPEYNYQYEKVISDEGPLNANRYFILEYTGESFLQEEYQLAQVPFYTKLQREDNPIVPEPISKPYVPKLKKITASYSSQEVVFQSENETLGEQKSQIAYRLPFGTRPIPNTLNSEEKRPLLCPYENSGELYLGLSNAKPGDSISILFQLADGTAKANTEKPVVEWYYQSGETWKRFEAVHQLLDHTKGLTQTGIKIIQLPEDSTTDSKELPDDLYWIKILAVNHSEGLPKVVSILTGVGHAVLHDQAPKDHYDQPLPVGSITEMSVYYPEINEIIQPFSSSKGRGYEDPNEFYHRVSKRLRHKNRALTMWDYEQLVLYHFPMVFKVKCLSADHLRIESPGKVNIVVISDVRGQVPFTPLQPRLPDYELINIQEKIAQLAPPFAVLEVTNPDYLAIKVRLGVKLIAGYQPDLSITKLNQEIKEFLSPWAYNVADEISFGGEVYANTLIGHIENLPYIDYIANIKLFQNYDGISYEEVFAEDGFLKVVADSSSTVIVSAESHELDLIGENGYVVANFDGINFNKVELDFRVGV